MVAAAAAAPKRLRRAVYLLPLTWRTTAARLQVSGVGKLVNCAQLLLHCSHWRPAYLERRSVGVGRFVSTFVYL